MDPAPPRALGAARARRFYCAAVHRTQRSAPPCDALPPLAREGAASPSSDAPVYARVATRLSELLEQVRSITVDVDEKRQLLSIVATDHRGTPHLASSLSDGTLRFLALAVMAEEAHPRAMLCLEEPENGMHPSRIPAMLSLLQGLAVAPELAVAADDNPLRQVIINTHSPSVVSHVPDDALLVARLVADTKRSDVARLLPLSNTWRSDLPGTAETVSKGELLAYLDPIGPRADASPTSGQTPSRKVRRVKDRPDLQLLIPFNDAAE